jgi:hypothetical protein
MDTDLLVEQKTGGQRLIEQLVRDDFPVSAAFWVRTSEDGSWHLDIASPTVDEKHSNDAYLKLYASIDKIDLEWVTPADTTLLNVQNPIVRAVIELRDVFADSLPAYYQGQRLGTLAIKGAYIYPEIEATRLSYTVTYTRTGNENHWKAAVKRGQSFTNIKLKGVTSYTTAHFPGETEADQRYASVGVLVEIDPRFNRSEILDQTDFKKMTGDQARRMADERFKSRHPDAVIEPELDERV